MLRAAHSLSAATGLGAATTRECVAIITRDVDEHRDPCRFRRLAALVGSATGGGARDVFVLHATNGSVRASSAAALQRAGPVTLQPQPAAWGAWRAFGGKITGYSKASFLLWLLHERSARHCTRAWQVEDDVFFTGPWWRLFEAHASSRADLVADHQIFSPASAPRGGTTEPCFLNKTARCVDVAPTVVIWPLLRLSRSLAMEVARTLTPRTGGAGFHEWLTGAVCRRASPQCVMQQLNQSVVGRVASGHSPGFKFKLQQSLEELCSCGLIPQRSGAERKRLNQRTNRTAREYPSDRAYHPVKCEADASLGRKALRFAGIYSLP